MSENTGVTFDELLLPWSQIVKHHLKCGGMSDSSEPLQSSMNTVNSVSAMMAAVSDSRT